MTTLLVAATTYAPTWQQVSGLIQSLTPFGAHGPVLIFDNTPEPSPAAGSTDSDAQRPSPSTIQAAAEGAGIQYARADGNVGTAGALNHAVDLATSLDIDWLLYFDQDSQPGPGFASGVVNRLASAAVSVAAVGSVILEAGKASAGSSYGVDEPLLPVRYAIASGTAFRVAAVRAVGRFDESMALDLVDHEMCLRLRAASYGITVDPAWLLHHEIGESGRMIPAVGIRVQRHPWWRRELMWRNTILLCRRHLRHAPSDCLRILIGRLLESTAAALVFRDPRFLSAGMRGISQGFTATTSAIRLP